MGCARENAFKLSASPLIVSGRIDRRALAPYDSAAMLAPLPDQIDIERAVAAGREYVGVLPLHRFARLASMLHDVEGEVRYALRFDRNVIGQLMVAVEADANLPLLCQSTLERFELPVSVRTRLGFISREEDESGLPEGFEPCMMTQGFADPLALIEDELILTVPVIARKPDVAPVIQQQEVRNSESAKPNPFAALAALKRK